MAGAVYGIKTADGWVRDEKKRILRFEGDDAYSKAAEYAGTIDVEACTIERLRGFAALDPLRQSELAHKGGKSAHAKGSAHEFTSAEAKIAGKKGGLRSKELLERRRSAAQ